VHVLDVNPVGAVKPDGWSENWTTEACRRVGSAKITYVKTDSGMNVSASEVKLRSAPRPAAKK
jgi:hypothetical protein